ncbi:hypothetical protein F4859DRAFT_498349 [Xylaria cf. heliscus]|nr:hypothetical protein F4859DRAFT_498349 [Xylaria cf. heliscus]
MATAVSDIADDWEHVDDDTLSIVSLVSEDDILVPARDRLAGHAVSSSSSLADDPVPSSSSPRPRSESPTRNGNGDRNGNSNSNSNSNGNGNGNVPRPSDTNRDPSDGKAVAKSRTNEARNVRPYTPRLRLRENAPIDGEPGPVCSGIAYLINLLGRLLSDPYLKGQSHRIPGNFKTNCEVLSSQLEKVHALMRVYPPTPDSAFATELSTWMGALEFELLKLQGILDDGLEIQFALVQDLPDLYIVHESCRKIESLRAYMDRVMATTIRDSVAFGTPPVWASKGSSSTSNLRIVGHSSRYILSRNRDNSFTPRYREMYTLRDQIVACLGEIHSYEHHGISDPEQRKKIATLTLNYKKTKESLDRMLSTHEAHLLYNNAVSFANYWIRQLDPDTIYSLVIELKEVTDRLFSERSKVQTPRRKDDRREYEKLVVCASSIDTLRAIDEALVTILRLPTRNKLG